MGDLARELDLPLLVVSRPGLGALNHTALTIEAARRRAIDVAGIVISDYPAKPDLATRTNPRLIIERPGAPLLGVLPYIDGLSTEELRPANLAQVARAALAPPLGGRFDSEEFLDRIKASVQSDARR